MLRKELVHSCSYPVIADAALRSLGCDLRGRVNEAAGYSGHDAGAFAAGLVRRFSEEATVRDWRHVEAVMSGDETPLLTGFRYIVEFMLESNEGAWHTNVLHEREGIRTSREEAVCAA